MKRFSEFQPIYEQTEMENDVIISCTFASDPTWDPISLVENPGNYETFPGSLLLSEQLPDFKQTSIQPFDIEDPIFEETYTAYVTKRSSQWCGWIPDVPEVECEEKTKTELLKTLADELHKALEAEEEEWKKLFGEAVKAGKFEPLREEALEDVRAERFTYL
ncbi:MAG: hypothetical protein OXN25_21505 [Candidatus Poribacteria bacterium]|nr:hypothetical protein [Candidatus Poribacteria bacterium]